MAHGQGTRLEEGPGEEVLPGLPSPTRSGEPERTQLDRSPTGPGKLGLGRRCRGRHRVPEHTANLPSPPSRSEAPARAQLDRSQAGPGGPGQGGCGRSRHRMPRQAALGRSADITARGAAGARARETQQTLGVLKDARAFKTIPTVTPVSPHHPNPKSRSGCARTLAGTRASRHRLRAGTRGRERLERDTKDLNLERAGAAARPPQHPAPLHNWAPPGPRPARNADF